jgi:hypothetical protein
MDVGAAHGAGGVEDAAWGAAEVVGAAREAAEVGEVGNRGVVQGRVVRPPGVAVVPLAPVPRAV